LAAAAAKWKVPVSNLRAERSRVINTVNGQEISFKDLYAEASRLPVPQNPVLKNYKDYKLVGKQGQKKTNLRAVLTGKMQYSIDVKIPGMLYGAVVHCPVYGGKAISWDEISIQSVPGIVKLVEVKAMGDAVTNHGGVGIIASSRHSAFKAQQMLKVKWDLGANAKWSTASYNKMLLASAAGKGDMVMDEKGKEGVLQTTDASWIKGSYSIPFLAHATLEPVNCIAQFKNGKFELWGGFQSPSKVVTDCGKFFGVSASDIFINLQMMGGGFGRKLNVDFAGEAMQLAKSVDSPVQLLFTRADDIRFGTFRPASAHVLSAKLGVDGMPVVLQHSMAMTPVGDYYDGTPVKENLTYGLNGGFEGDMIYNIPSVVGSVKRAPVSLVPGWWRAVNFTHNTFVLESFIDELAIKTKKDPLEYRLKLLAGLQPMVQKGFISYNPRRMEQVLKIAGEKIGWGRKKNTGTGFGIACCFYNHAKAYTAHAFEVEVNVPAKTIKMIRAVVVTDIGIVIDPDGLYNQIEGGFTWAMSAALKSEITFTGGLADQGSYFDFQVCRMGDLPPLDITVIKSNEAPGGAGETSVPSVFASLTNAIFNAGGPRVRKLPLASSGWVVSV
jgi:isoquinoline 1-oxidoreductase beta subunit